jgi:roadblock/LC7 domain-containing protein
MDGIDELLMTSGFMAQGEFTEMAALVSFQDGRMRVVQDFGTVVSDVCASGRPGSTARAAVLSITNAALGQMPKIRADNYVAGCGKVRRWRPFRGEM